MPPRGDDRCGSARRRRARSLCRRPRSRRQRRDQAIGERGQGAPSSVARQFGAHGAAIDGARRSRTAESVIDDKKFETYKRKERTPSAPRSNPCSQPLQADLQVVPTDRANITLLQGDGAARRPHDFVLFRSTSMSWLRRLGPIRFAIADGCWKRAAAIRNAQGILPGPA